jgi:hypothetical protein
MAADMESADDERLAHELQQSLAANYDEQQDWCCVCRVASVYCYCQFVVFVCLFVVVCLFVLFV